MQQLQHFNDDLLSHGVTPQLKSSTSEVATFDATGVLPFPAGLREWSGGPVHHHVLCETVWRAAMNAADYDPQERGPDVMQVFFLSFSSEGLLAHLGHGRMERKAWDGTWYLFDHLREDQRC